MGNREDASDKHGKKSWFQTKGGPNHYSYMNWQDLSNGSRIYSSCPKCAKWHEFEVIRTPYAEQELQKVEDIRQKVMTVLELTDAIDVRYIEEEDEN